MKLIFNAFRRVINHQRHYLWWWVIMTVLLSILWVVDALYASYAVDELLLQGAENNANLFIIFGVWIALFFVTVAILTGRKVAGWNMERVILAETRHSYYQHLLRLDISHHVQSRSGELMKRIDNAADALMDIWGQFVMELIPSLFTAAIFVVIAFTVNVWLTLVVLCLIPVYLVVTIIYIKWVSKHTDKVHLLWVQAMGRGYDVAANIFTVKSSGAETRELDRMREIHREGIRQLQTVEWKWALLESVDYFLLMRITLVGVGIWLLARNEITLGEIFFFQFSFFRIVVPFEMLENMVPWLGEKTSKVKLGEEFFATAITINEAKHPVKPKELKGEIVFDNVSFAYEEIEAIRKLNMRIEAGERIAIVGHSGAGKSTLAALLNRFYDVTDGRILVDGIDMRDLPMTWWRQQIGLVLQENIMFNDTVLENIRYSRPDATQEEIVEAASRAQADSFVRAFPKGYDTLIGERGIRLSGGERQRIAIARAILKKPKIVILDEATSALDSITEREVQEGIKELIEGRTAIIIAHRLSTVRSVDRIAVLEGGKLLAIAPHEELLKTVPLYREMVELQQGGVLKE